jgi:hypothetical protein
MKKILLKATMSSALRISPLSTPNDPATATIPYHTGLNVETKDEASSSSCFDYSSDEEDPSQCNDVVAATHASTSNDPAAATFPHPTVQNFEVADDVSALSSLEDEKDSNSWDSKHQLLNYSTESAFDSSDEEHSSKSTTWIQKRRTVFLRTVAWVSYKRAEFLAALPIRRLILIQRAYSTR